LAASTTGDNFDEFKIGRAAQDACSESPSSLYLKNPVRTSRRTQTVTITSINLLTLFKEIIRIYPEDHTEAKNTKFQVTCR
jgi:hypothetical protein